jgi:uncharacterized membrane protein
MVTATCNNSQTSVEHGSWRPKSFHELISIRDYRIIMISAIVVFILSSIGHLPIFHVYTDFLTFWNRQNSQGVPYLTYEIPYSQYVLEYPTLSGLILWLAGWASHDNVMTYFAISFTILGIFFILTTHVIYQFSDKLGINHDYQILFTIFAPSVLFFGPYNFDIMQAFFMVLALYMFVARKKQQYSAAALGLAIATKLFPIILIPFLLQDLGSLKAKVSYALISLGIVALLNLPFAVLNFSNWISGYTYFRKWGLEDTFLLWIFRTTSSLETAEFVSGGLVLLSVLVIFVFLRDRPLLIRCLFAIASFLLFSYISTPQMNLDLIPFFALVPLVPLPLFYLFEGATVAFMSLWNSFPNSEAPGVVQGIALIRQLALVLITINVWRQARNNRMERKLPISILKRAE